MNNESCNHETIDRLLGTQLSDDQLAAFETHVEDCDTCRAELERRATSSGASWQETGDFLRDEPYESHPLSGTIVSSTDPTDVDEASLDDPLRVKQLLAPTDDPRMLGRLGPYEIAGVIGAGGMGIVLKGFDAALNRYVAIKVLAPHLAASGAARQRFAREAQAAAAVVHDNVIEIHGVAEANSLPYLVMPYLRGESLQKRLDDHGPLEVTEVLRIAKQCADGLAAAHAQGLVHRDIKPGNILLADGVDRVKITDFGLARAADDASLTHSGVIAGTPQFMSPEQARGQTVDPRSDLFSLGSLIYAMCAGRPPFRADNSYGVLRLITDEQPRLLREVNPAIPDWLCSIIERLHAKSPDERYATANHVGGLLGECLAHVQTPSQPLPAELKSRQNNQFDSKRAGILAGSFLTIAIAAAMLWQPWLAGDSADNRKPVLPGPEVIVPGATDQVPEAAANEQPAITNAELEWTDGTDRELLNLSDSATRLDAAVQEPEVTTDGRSQ